MIGLEGKVYYSATGVPASSAGYTELEIVESVDAPSTRDEAQVKIRGQESVLYEVGHIDEPVTMTTLYDPADVGYIALETAFLARSVVGMAFLDGEIGALMTGFEGDYKISERSRPQPIDGVWMTNWKFVPAVDGVVRPREYTHTA